MTTEIQKAGAGFLVIKDKVSYFRRTLAEANTLAALLSQSNGAGGGTFQARQGEENLIERLRYGLSLMEAEIEAAERGELAGPKGWAAQRACEEEGGEGCQVWTGNGFQYVEWWGRFKRDTGVADKAGFFKLAKGLRAMLALANEAERKGERQ